jgi:hypothetical protein
MHHERYTTIVGSRCPGTAHRRAVACTFHLMIPDGPGSVLPVEDGSSRALPGLLAMSPRS